MAQSRTKHADRKTGRRVAILCYLDKSANSIRPAKLKQLLEARGHEVVLVNSLDLTRRSHGFENASATDKRARSFRLPSILHAGISLFNKLSFYRFCDHFSLLEMQLSAAILEPILKRERFDVVICMIESQSLVLTRGIAPVTILDSPAPSVEETWYGGHLMRWEYDLMRKRILNIYRSVTYLNFHWYLYAEYVRKHLYDGKNMVEVNWGCIPKKLRAKYAAQPRILFLGNLGGYWNNFPLLSALAKQHPIDVYGAPAPSAKWGLNYKGFAPSTPDGIIPVVAQYQFGLITITEDELRKHSFSSKHLEYLSYGLPVLTPSWRKDSRLKGVSIPYDEKTFLSQIRKFSARTEWQRLADHSYAASKSWQWDRVLAPMVALVENAPSRSR